MVGPIALFLSSGDYDLASGARGSVNINTQPWNWVMKLSLIYMLFR